jgi:hypothetical protein
MLAEAGFEIHRLSRRVSGPPDRAPALAPSARG